MRDAQPEFGLGARLTFQPYEKALGVTVVEVLPDHFGDGRVVYHVEGLHAKSFTPGECLKESKLYQPPDPLHLLDRFGFPLNELR